MAKLDLNRFNARVKDWGKETRKAMQQMADDKGITHRYDSPSIGSSIKKLKESFNEQEGAINQIGFKFRRTLVFAHHGAGKGRGGSKGSRWIDKYMKPHTTKASSLGKMGTLGRRAKPFINEVLSAESGVENVATIAAEELGESIINQILI